MTPDPNEISPYLVGQITQGGFHPALWKLNEGALAITLFLTRESAQTYKGLLEGKNWHEVQPDKATLKEILSLAVSAGISVAVLEPTGTTGKRLFSIPQILEGIGPFRQ